MSAAELLERLGRRRGPGAAPPRGTVRTGSRGRPQAGTRGRGRGASRRVDVRQLLASTTARRGLAGFVILLLLLGGLWLWFRDSSFVSVKRVSVIGASGPDASAIRSALSEAARNMTTLDVQMRQLDTAVKPYPVVKSLQVSTQFPHGMRIDVKEENPVAAIEIGGHQIAVASDGTLLKDAGGFGTLPLITLRTLPGGSRLTDAGAMQDVALLAAAPYQLLPKLSQASVSGTHGLVAQLRNGPSLYFGDASRLDAKWAAAVAALNASSTAGAQYIDLSDPEHPAAGALAPTGTTATGTAGGTATGTAAGATSTPATTGTATAPVGGTSATAGTSTTPPAGG